MGIYNSICLKSLVLAIISRGRRYQQLQKNITMASVTESTPILTPTQVTPTQKVVCPKTDCDKAYKARSSMLTHMRQKHQDVADIPSPLGCFPPSGSATVLQFDESDDAAAQGNSSGDVNSPEVRTKATYICDLCETHIKSKEAFKFAII